MKYCWILACLFAGLIFVNINAAGNDILYEGDLMLTGSVQCGVIFVSGELVVNGSLRCKSLVASKVYITNDLFVEPNCPVMFAIDVVKNIKVLGHCIALGNVRAPDIVAGSLNAPGVDAHSLTVDTLSIPDEHFRVTNLYYKKAIID